MTRHLAVIYICLASTIKRILIIEFLLIFGVWRSWLARTAGGREVAGSSPVTPTINHIHLMCRKMLILAIFLDLSIIPTI